jgi:hypothetical protein
LGISDCEFGISKRIIFLFLQGSITYEVEGGGYRVEGKRRRAKGSRPKV